MLLLNIWIRNDVCYSEYGIISIMKSLIVVAENFQDEEFVYPFYKLNEFSNVTVASSNGQDKFGKYGVPARVNSKFSKINGSDYDILVIPGGFECPDRLRIDDECLKIGRASCRERV